MPEQFFLCGSCPVSCLCHAAEVKRVALNPSFVTKQLGGLMRVAYMLSVLTSSFVKDLLCEITHTKVLSRQCVGLGRWLSQ